MDIEKLITDIRNRRINDSNDSLKAIAESEEYLNQAYEGRYLYELIQNVRDANVGADAQGLIHIELKDSELWISNTGSPFTVEGIESITTIGKSPKSSQEFIGFKGIGFKSVQKVTNRPRIITQWGTLLFDKQKSHKLLQDRQLETQDIPLFFLPHYCDKSISDIGQNGDFITQIVLPLNNVEAEAIISDFQKIGSKQLILLGNLNYIFFHCLETKIEYRIEKNPNTGKTTITKDTKEESFKHFKPRKKISIPQEIIKTLNEKEKELYQNNPYVDISLVFELNERDHLSENKDAKLYLFYPLKISSGFPFIIHSYFLVNPERTELRDNRLNTYILEQIADYISGEWLSIAKKNHPSVFLEFLIFKRNDDHEILNTLYNKLVEKLNTKRFIYDKISKRFYSLDQIVIADIFDKGLFLDNIFNKKRIIYIRNKGTRDWLLKEFEITYLSYNAISEHIEKECRSQKRKGKQSLTFFHNLYKYIVEHDGLDVSGKKILLTSNWQLRSSDDDVFYGMSKQDKVKLPESIQKYIHFIHPDIKISDQREGKGQTGYLEYNTELLIRRLLKLYEKKGVPKKDILDSLLQLNISDRLLPSVRQKIWLPVNSETKWVKPMHNPVYIQQPKLRELYADNLFIDYTHINQLPHITEEEINIKLLTFGAWDIPGIYFSEKYTKIERDDSRFDPIYRIKWYSTTYFVLNHTWNLDIPSKYTEWFSHAIISNWDKYRELIEDDEYSKVHFRSKDSNFHNVPKHLWFQISNFLDTIRNTNWLVIDESRSIFTPYQIVGIDPSDIVFPRYQILAKYLPLLHVHYLSNRSFMEDLRIIHFNAPNIENYKRLFEFIFEEYRTTPELPNDFKTFYSRLLSKLFEFYKYQLELPQSINEFSECHFLCENKYEESLSWLPANKIYHIDDMASYHILPDSIKQKIQPHFTIRDKNRFGQIAGKIGNKLSSSVSRTLRHQNFIEEHEAKDFFPHLPEQIALIETYIEDSLDEILTTISKTKIYIQENVEIEIKIKGDKLKPKAIPVNHYILPSDNPRIYISQAVQNNMVEFYVAPFHELMVELRGYDLKMIQTILENFMISSSKEKLLQKYQIENDRIQEIKSILYQQVYTPEQEFWHGILITINEPNPHTFFNNTAVNFAKLKSLREVHGFKLEPLHSRIDFVDLNNPINIDPISKVLNYFNIPFANFVTSTTLRIDFYDYHSNRFNTLKSKYKDFISWSIWTKLQNNSIQEQRSFQDLVDIFDYDISFIERKKMLDYDTEEYLWNKINENFHNFSIKNIDFIPNYNYEKELIQILTVNRITIEKELKIKKIFNKDGLEEFSKQNKNRSLLYFGRNLEFIELYEQFIKENNSSSNENKAHFNLANYKSEQSKPIKRITMSSTNGGSWNEVKGTRGRGKRSSGDENQKTKEEVGLVAEFRVYHQLKKIYGNVKWISKNAARANINPEGSDNNVHKCDIIYMDKQNNLHYVEVKGQVSDDKRFYISLSELTKAKQEKESYSIYYVSNALDNDSWEIYDLGNIFILEMGEDLLNNSRYNASFKTLEISFE